MMIEACLRRTSVLGISIGKGQCFAEIRWGYLWDYLFAYRTQDSSLLKTGRFGKPEATDRIKNGRLADRFAVPFAVY